MLKKGQILLGKIGGWIRYHKLPVVVSVIVIGAFLLIQGGDQTNWQQYQVIKTDVVDAVELTGTVSAVDRADLSWQASGRIIEINVNEGDVVARGDVLARIDSGNLSAERSRSTSALSQARAGVMQAQASVDQAQASLDRVIAENRGTDSNLGSVARNLNEVRDEQETLVANAKRALNNVSLQAHSIDSNQTVAEPIISGTYNSDEVGEYRLEFYRSSARTGYSVRFSGLENGVVSFSDVNLPVALGTRGLYISIPQIDSYSFNTFVVPIPNERSSSYQVALNNYRQAQATSDRLVQAAEAELNRLQALENSNGDMPTVSGSVEAQARATLNQARAAYQSAIAAVSAARAGVASIDAQLDSFVIRAPFSGTIARMNANLGETASPNQTAMTLVSAGDFEVELQVPEIDVARLMVDMPVSIVLDAYNDALTWQGVIKSIQNIETTVEGVPVYITTVTILDPDARIKIGMNARATIELDRTENVIAVPNSFINNEEGRQYVLIIDQSGNITERTITIGNKGSNSLVEIISGLNTQDTLVREELDG